jgi:hypothetical protein
MSALIDSSSTPAQIDWSQFESLSPTNTVQLEASWLALTAKYPSSNSAPELLDEIFKQYQEPGRRHHTLPHIATPHSAYVSVSGW